jgi:alcohol dehydrogenase class IV
MRPFVHEQLPGRVVFGPGVFTRLADELDRLRAGRDAALLPHVVRFNAPAAPGALRRIAGALGVDDAAGGIYDFAVSVGAPTSLAAIGMKETSLSEAARLCAQSVTWNPRPVSENDILAILQDAFAGRRPAAGP